MDDLPAKYELYVDGSHKKVWKHKRVASEAISEVIGYAASLRRGDNQWWRLGATIMGFSKSTSIQAEIQALRLGVELLRAHVGSDDIEVDLHTDCAVIYHTINQTLRADHGAELRDLQREATQNWNIRSVWVDRQHPYLAEVDQAAYSAMNVAYSAAKLGLRAGSAVAGSIGDLRKTPFTQ